MKISNEKHEKEAKTNSKKFGRWLHDERVSKGLSLEGLANTLKVTKGYLSRLERSKTKPSKMMIERLAVTMKTGSKPLYQLAGYLPKDVEEILNKYTIEATGVLRETFGSSVAEESQSEYKHKSSIFSTDLSEHKRRAFNLKSLYKLVHGDCFKWADQQPPNSIHAIVTDPPYGIKEYSPKEKTKLRNGRGGVWRIPPEFDGCRRSPLPRFTVLTNEEKEYLKLFFSQWAYKMYPILVPGAHIFIATNPLLSHVVYKALIENGFEKRGEIIRLVQTLRGGDRPKNAHKEFQNVTVMPRSCWEPWGIFRRPCEGRVQDNLRKWKTGGLRRVSEDQPFCDVIKSAPTRSVERDIAPHPSLKPQAFMRQIVRASLPLGEGIILDPFMGGGSTIAAACFVGYRSIGIESDSHFFNMAVQAIPRLASFVPNGENSFRGKQRYAKNDNIGQKFLFED